MTRLTDQERKDHQPSYSRYTRGKSIPGNRTVYGYRVRCSCGAPELRVNGNLREATRRWREHILAARK